MCSCQTHSAAAKTAEPDAAVISLHVEDMTCGHCAGTVKSAIESSLPGAKVDADPGSRRVSVTGATDLERIKAIVASAGYTPTAVEAVA